MADWLGPARQTYYYVDDDGNLVPAAGWLLFHYEPDSDDYKDTWQDPNEDSLNTNPVVLDANGEASIFGNGIYRQRFTNADETVERWDRVTGDLSATDVIDPDADILRVFDQQFERLGSVPVADEVIGIAIFVRAVQIPADFDGTVDGFAAASGYQLTDPTASVEIIVNRGAVGSATRTQIGTITVGTDGLWTWETTGNLPQAFDADDLIEFVAPSVEDATWAGIFWTITGNVL
jgi:hypothetical protein